MTEDDRPRHKSATALGLTSRAPARAGSLSDGTPRRVDNDVTPRPVDVGDLTRMTPAEQIKALADAMATHAAALEHEQRQRHKLELHGEQLARIETQLERVIELPQKVYETGTAVSEIHKQLSNVANILDRLTREQERDNAMREQSEKSWDRALAAIGRVEKDQGRMETALGVLSTRVDASTTNLRDDVTRLRAQQDAHAGRITSVEAKQMVVSALTKREQRKERGKGVVLTALTGGAAWLAQHFLK